MIRTTRRRFLQGALPCMVAPLVLPSRVVRGKDLPSRTVTLGCIGVGGQGGALLRMFLNVNRARVVAVSDCFQGRREDAVHRVNEKNGDNGCASYQDFRELLARDDLDAVVIATPDHWHVPVAMAAMQAGKDVYLEKPLGLSLEQNFAVREAGRRHGRMFQYGTQQRSSEHVRRGCELVLNGRLGKLHEVEVVAPAGASGGSALPVPVPADLDYDRWLGPAPWTPYTPDRCTSAGSWYVYDNSLGFIAGWGAHPLDVLLWAFGDEPAGVPVEYTGTGEIPASGLFNTVTKWDVRGRLADGTAFRFRDGPDATIFRGERGELAISRNGWRAQPASLLREPMEPGDRRLEVSTNHYANFVEGVRTRRPPVSPLHSAVRSDTISHLADYAIRSGRTIRWDPVRETVPGDPEAVRRMRRAQREPWTS